MKMSSVNTCCHWLLTPIKVDRVCKFINYKEKSEISIVNEINQRLLKYKVFVKLYIPLMLTSGKLTATLFPRAKKSRPQGFKFIYYKIYDINMGKLYKNVKT